MSYSCSPHWAWEHWTWLLSMSMGRRQHQRDITNSLICRVCSFSSSHNTDKYAETQKDHLPKGNLYQMAVCLTPSFLRNPLGWWHYCKGASMNPWKAILDLILLAVSTPALVCLHNSYLEAMYSLKPDRPQASSTATMASWWEGKWWPMGQIWPAACFYK